MEAASVIEGHPVADLCLILILSVRLHNAAQCSVPEHEHDSEDTRGCSVTGRRVTADAVTFHHHLAVHIAPDMLRAQVYLYVRFANAVIFSLVIIGSNIVIRFAGILLITAAYCDQSAIGRLELTVHTDCIGVDRKFFQELPELLVPDLIILDKFPVVILDKPVLHDI